MRYLRAAVFAGILACALPAWADTPLAVLCLRQYLEQGPSALHLYLYTLDGHLVKQLTATPGLDDEAPFLDPEGKSVIFFRSSTVPETKAAEGDYLLTVATGQLARISAADLPAQRKLHQQTLQPAEFTWPSDGQFKPDPAEGPNAVSSRSADGKYELIQKPNPSFDENSPATDIDPYFYDLRTTGAPGEVALRTLPGYVPWFANPSFLELNGTPFVQMPRFDALFMERHVDSTEGDSLWMLNLQSLRWTLMSMNAGLLYAVPGRNEIIFLHSARYEDLGKTGHEVNCGYLEFWDGSPRPIRLSPPVSLFHGGSIFYGHARTVVIPDPDYGS